jgi:hypothetical protein
MSSTLSSLIQWAVLAQDHGIALSLQLREKTMAFWNPFRDEDPAGLQAAEALQASAQAVLRDWAGLRAEPSGRPPRRPGNGMVCLAVKVDGQPATIVSVAATHHLGAQLAVAATGDPGAGSFSGEALRELCTLLRERLSRDAEGRSPLTLMPEPLDESQWPGQAPEAELCLLVNGQPLEIRLWHP